MQNSFGLVALLGSGETSLAGGRVFESIAGRFSGPVRISILETPAGFELNSPKVAGRVSEFLKARLHEYYPQIDIVPARKRGTPFSPDDLRILEPLLHADIIFMGPGSPTYAVRQLKGSLAWELVRARHRQGTALVFASAAVIAVGAFSLPVYEIYKAGEDVTVAPGLDFFSDFGLNASFTPHWNNSDGGDELDTSRCFVGLERYRLWRDLLPTGHTTLGLDEHTGIIFNLANGKCSVSGVGSVTLVRARNSEIIMAGTEFGITELGEFHWPAETRAGISNEAWNLVKNAEQADHMQDMDIPTEISRLAEARLQARNCQDWAEADILRLQLAALGWIARDTPEGQKLIRQS